MSGTPDPVPRREVAPRLGHPEVLRPPRFVAAAEEEAGRLPAARGEAEAPDQSGGVFHPLHVPAPAGR